MRSSSRPTPIVGDVIRYAYLWSHEHAAGREEATKDRPAAVVALIRGEAGQDQVVVLPITSSQPADAAAGVAIPAATRTRLGLQSEPCWIMVSEFNVFVWPGPDLRPDSLDGSVIYGRLPARLMDQVRAALADWRRGGGQKPVRRTE